MVAEPPSDRDAGGSAHYRISARSIPVEQNTVDCLRLNHGGLPGNDRFLTNVRVSAVLCKRNVIEFI